MTHKTCFQIAKGDTVAVVLEDADAGEALRIIGPDAGEITLREAIEYGHKVALYDTREGDPVMKYGISIGAATCDIQAGESVHLHNCASQYDERSAAFDHKTGAATDTPYA